jgi:hypothetical protein
MQDGIRAVQQAFTQASTPPRWPMYVRQAKQYLRNAIENFDERKYGFASVVDLLRAAGKEGVLRIERDRQGAVRVFPGGNLTPKTSVRSEEPEVDEIEETTVDLSADNVEPMETISAEPVIEPEPVAEPPIVDANVTDLDVDVDEPEAGDVNGNIIGSGPKPATGRKRKTPAARGSRAPRAAKTARPRGKKAR